MGVADMRCAYVETRGCTAKAHVGSQQLKQISWPFFAKHRQHQARLLCSHLHLAASFKGEG
jgi:hypothetical protein